MDAKRLRVVSGDTSRTPNADVTSVSLSIQDSGTALQFACAEARWLLLGAAATRLNVTATELEVNDGVVTSRSGGRTTRVVRPRAPRAKLLSVDIAAIKAMPGVLAVVRDGSFLAVAASREEQAIAAAQALQAGAKWDVPGDLPPSGTALFTHMRSQRSVDTLVNEKKNADAAATGTTKLVSEFSRPYQAHASIGPSCAVAQWNDGKLQIWCHSQGVFPLRADMAKVLRMPPASNHGDAPRRLGLLRPQRR